MKYSNLLRWIGGVLLIVSQNHHIYAFTFTYMYLADAFIQSDLQAIHLLSVYTIKQYHN